MTTYVTVQTETEPIEIVSPNLNSLPSELTEQPMAVWRAAPIFDKETEGPKRKVNGKLKFKKRPENIGGIKLRPNDSKGWNDFDLICQKFDPDVYSGVGLLLQQSSGLVAIDLDEVYCLEEKYPGTADLIAKAEAEEVYCETSPSGDGLRMFVFGSLESAGINAGGVELYSDKRFVTVTGGRKWPGKIKEAQWLINELLGLIGRNGSSHKNQSRPEGFVEVEVDPSKLRALIDYGKQARPPLWAGEWKEKNSPSLVKGYPSQSEADMSLIGTLANQACRMTLDRDEAATLILRAFEKSGLYRAEKEIQIRRYAIPKALGNKIHEEDSLGIEKRKKSEIDEVNDRFGLIEGQGIYDRRNGCYIKQDQFSLLYKNRVISIGDAQSPRSLTLDRAWLSSKERAQYTGLRLAPFEPLKTALGELNTYQGFAIEPQAGDVTPFLELTQHLVPDDQNRAYLMKFLAFKIQNPGMPYKVALVLWSLGQGVGKNLAIETWASLFHVKHHIVVGQEIFSDQFTDWQHSKLIVIADEVSSTGSRTVSDRLKGWVTATQNQINSKGLPKFSEENLISYVFLSNHQDAVHLEKYDRRFWVCQCTSERLSDEQVKRFNSWRQSGGQASLLRYLLDFDVSGFDPQRAAPMTESKESMIEDSWSDLERWVNTVLTADGVARLIGRELVTVTELCELYKLKSSREVSSKAMNGAVLRCGAKRLKKQARCKNGVRPRVYALANFESYEVMSDYQLGEIIDSSRVRWVS